MLLPDNWLRISHAASPVRLLSFQPPNAPMCVETTSGTIELDIPIVVSLGLQDDSQPELV